MYLSHNRFAMTPLGALTSPRCCSLVPLPRIRGDAHILAVSTTATVDMPVATDNQCPILPTHPPKVRSLCLRQKKYVQTALGVLTYLRYCFLAPLPRIRDGAHTMAVSTTAIVDMPVAMDSQCPNLLVHLPNSLLFCPRQNKHAQTRAPA